MSSWVPLRSAPPESQCAPSTSYSSQQPLVHNVRPRARCHGASSRRGRALQIIRCQASSAIQSYHNAYRLLHQGRGSAGLAIPPDVAPEADLLLAAESAGPSNGQASETLQQRPQQLPLLANTQQQPEQQQNGSTGSGSNGGGAAVDQPPASRAGHHPDEAALPAASISLLPAPDFIPPGLATLPSQPGLPLETPTSEETGRYRPSNVGPYKPHPTYLRDWAPPRTSREHQMALTHAIMTCPNYGRLHELLLDNANDFNTYHSCATLNRMLTLHAAGFTPRESRQFKEGCSSIMVILRRQLQDMEPRSLAVVAYSLARLELPDRELLTGLVTVTEPQLHLLQPQGLSSLLWAFARQGFAPPAKWMEAWLTVSCAKLGHFSFKDLSTTLWSLSQLHYKMAGQHQDHIMRRVGELLEKSDSRGLASMLYALATSQQHPGPEVLASVQRRAVELGPQAHSPVGMTQICWSLAKLGAAPSPELLQLLRRHMETHLPPPTSPQQREQLAREVRRPARGPSGELAAGTVSHGGGVRQQRRYGGIDMAMLMYALAIWGTRPSVGLSKRMLLGAMTLLPSLEAKQLCNVAWACARLRLFPWNTWVRTFMDASYRLLPQFGSGDLSQALWSLARMDVTPPPAWLSLAMARLTKIAYMFGPTEVAATLWALARLGVRGEAMPSEVLALFFVATDKRLSSFKPLELCAMIGALATMRRRPDKEWTAEFLKATYHKLAAMDGWNLAHLAWALAEIPLVPPPAWIYSYVNAARGLLEATPVPPVPPPAVDVATTQEAPSGGLPAAGEAAAVSGDMSAIRTPDGVVHTSAGDGSTAVGSARVGLSALDLAQIIRSLRRLNELSGSGGLAKVENFLRDAEAMLGAMEAADGAYTRQQLQLFMGISRRLDRQAEGAGAHAGEGSEGSGAESEGERRARRRKEVMLAKLEIGGRAMSEGGGEGRKGKGKGPRGSRRDNNGRRGGSSERRGPGPQGAGAALAALPDNGVHGAATPAAAMGGLEQPLEVWSTAVLGGSGPGLVRAVGSSAGARVTLSNMTIDLPGPLPPAGLSAGGMVAVGHAAGAAAADSGSNGNGNGNGKGSHAASAEHLAH